jgi:riboflavin kinase / FMN adenylyltransferase
MKLHRRSLVLDTPVAMAIGNFDGMHRGHAALIDATVMAARTRGLRAAAMTFDPLAREYFARQKGLAAPPRLMTLREKCIALHARGIDDIIAVPFDALFSRQSASDFILKLRTSMQVRWLTVGHDFRFGAGRTGSIQDLQAASVHGAFEFVATAQIDDGSCRVSSTAVREALAAGDLDHAQRLLGRRYAMTGRVVHGAKRGRQLGFPTANVALGQARKMTPPLWGVYAVKLRVITGTHASAKPYLGVASLGRNPAVKTDGIPSLEVHLFDFAGDLYGARVQVEFHHKLRDEAYYASIAELVTAIQSDCNEARGVFGKA